MEPRAVQYALSFRWFTLGLGLGLGLAAGEVCAGFSRRAWLSLGCGVVLVCGLTWFIVWILPSRPDPLDLFRGVRWPTQLVTLFALGLSFAVAHVEVRAPGLLPFRSPIGLIPTGMCLVWMTAQAIWYLSWPRSHPTFGRVRWVGWILLAFAVVDAWLFLHTVINRWPLTLT